MEWEVRSDPVRIAELRRLASERIWTAEKMLDHIAVEKFERSLVVELLTPPERWIPRLKALLADPAPSNPWIAIRAGWYLLYLGEPAGTQLFMSMLGSADLKDRRGAVVSLCSSDQTLPYDRDALARALAPEVHSSDPRQRDQVGTIYWRHRLPGWERVLEAQLDDPEQLIRLNALNWLSSEGGSADCLRRAEAQLVEAHEQRLFAVIGALTSMAEAVQGLVRLPAAKILMDYIRGNLQETDVYTANHIMNACRALRKGGHIEVASVLREVIASPQKGPFRESALSDLARLLGRVALRDLDAALKDKDLERTAAAEIAYLGRNTGDPDLLALLSRAIGTSKHADVFVQALCSIDGTQARAIIREFLPATMWWERLEAEWCLRSISHREAIYRLIELGVLTQWPESAMAAGLLEPDDQGNPPGARTAILRALKSSGRYLCFDLEVGMVPVDHDVLIQDFSKISDGIFNPDAVAQTWKEAEETQPPYTVEFVYRDRLHRFTARCRGDYI